VRPYFPATVAGPRAWQAIRHLMVRARPLPLPYSPSYEGTWRGSPIRFRSSRTRLEREPLRRDQDV